MPLKISFWDQWNQPHSHPPKCYRCKRFFGCRSSLINTAIPEQIRNTRFMHSCPMLEATAEAILWDYTSMMAVMALDRAVARVAYQRQVQSRIDTVHESEKVDIPNDYSIYL